VQARLRREQRQNDDTVGMGQLPDYGPQPIHSTLTVR
jgi:hypothetical protein